MRAKFQVNGSIPLALQKAGTCCSCTGVGSTVIPANVQGVVAEETKPIEMHSQSNRPPDSIFTLCLFTALILKLLHMKNSANFYSSNRRLSPSSCGYTS